MQVVVKGQTAHTNTMYTHFIEASYYITSNDGFLFLLRFDVVDGFGSIPELDSTWYQSGVSRGMGHEVSVTNM